METKESVAQPFLAVRVRQSNIDGVALESGSR